jgi:hypothetical protein
VGRPILIDESTRGGIRIDSGGAVRFRTLAADQLPIQGLLLLRVIGCLPHPDGAAARAAGVR